MIGRISQSVTGTPALATCQAASVPARPAPITTTEDCSLKDDGIENSAQPYRSPSSTASFDHQLKLPNSSTTNVEPSPGKCQKDRRSHEHEPKVHEFNHKILLSLRTVGRSRDQQWAVRLVLQQLRPLPSQLGVVICVMPLILDFFLTQLTFHLCRHTRHKRLGWDILRDHRPSGNESPASSKAP